MNFDISLVLRINAGELPPNHRKYDQLVDYFNDLISPKLIKEERNKLERINEILKLPTYEEKWNYAELEFEGNIIDGDYKNFCWLDLKQYTPRLVLNYMTGELYLEYVLEQKFIPRFKIDRLNLLEMLDQWEKHITSS